MKKGSAFILLTILSTITGCVLVGSFSFASLSFSLAFSLVLAAFLTYSIYQKHGVVNGISLFILLKYLFFFLFYMYKSTFSCLYYVFTGKSSVSVREYTLVSTRDVFGVIVCNSITMTPGTATLEKQGKTIYVAQFVEDKSDAAHPFERLLTKELL